jgi:signal peptidase I
MKNKASGSKAKAESGLHETVRTIIYAVVIAFFVRTFLYEPFNIPSGSMEPTLLVGDYLFVSKSSPAASWGASRTAATSRCSSSRPIPRPTSSSG